MLAVMGLRSAWVTAFFIRAVDCSKTDLISPAAWAYRSSNLRSCSSIHAWVTPTAGAGAGATGWGTNTPAC